MKFSDAKLVRLIAVFKLLKAILLIAVGVAALKLLRPDVTDFLQEWAMRLGPYPGSRFVGRAILKAASLTPTRLKDIGAGSFIYAALFLTEGIGLWLLKRWAEWLTVIITSSLIPLEVYETYRHPAASKVLLLIINIAVVGFLVYRIRGRRPNVR
jgi:uncharacterized membrane protein (DUF2068 family)